MKTLLQVSTVVMIGSLLPVANAAKITDTFDTIPTEIQCNQPWTNQNVIFRFTGTIPAEDGIDIGCSFGVSMQGSVALGARLQCDFTLLQQPVTRIEVDVDDNCRPNCTKLFAYKAGSRFAVVTNVSQQYSTTFSTNFPVVHPDRCVMMSLEAVLKEIRIFIEDGPPKLAIEKTAGSLAITWPTNAGSYSLEKKASLAAVPDWTAESNIQIEGSNYVHRPSGITGTQFYRLRRN